LYYIVLYCIDDTSYLIGQKSCTGQSSQVLVMLLKR